MKSRPKGVSRVFAVLTAVSMVAALSVVAGPASAATKAGAKCTKKGLIAKSGGTTLQCLKAKGILVWVITKKNVKAVPKTYAKPTKSLVKIGMLSDLTGPNAAVGQYDRQWASLYTDKINSTGGLDGHPVEFVIYDTATDPAKAASGARRLIEKDGVSAIQCCVSSGEALQVMTVAHESGVPVVGGAIVGLLTDKDNNPAYGSYFRALPGEEDTATFNVQFAAKKGWKNIMVERSTLTYGSSGLNVIKTVAAANGVRVLGDVPVAPSATEGSAQAALLVRDKPDAILTWDYPVPTAVMAKEIRQAGYAGPIISNWSALNEAYWANAGKDIKNAYAHDAYDTTNPRSVQVVSEYANRYGVTPWSVHQVMMSNYIEVVGAAIIAAFKTTGTATGKAVTDGLLSLKCFKTTLGPVNSCIQFGRPYVSASGQNPYHGGSPSMLIMKTVSNGSWVPAN